MRDEEGYALDPHCRVGEAIQDLTCTMLEMGWLFTEVVSYIQRVEREESYFMMGAGSGSGRLQQAFVFTLKREMTEYYRLIAVLEAQLNLDAEAAAGGAGVIAVDNGEGGGGGTAGLTLRRLAVWVMDPMERLKLMAAMVGAAAGLR
ncbi:unnamed protein product, partial [Choristocarpus tenellus]